MCALSQCSRQLCICYNPPEYVAPCQHTPPALHPHCMRSLFRNSSPSLGTSFLHTLPQRYAPPEVSSSTGVYTPPARGSLSLLCVCSLQGVPLRLSLSLSLYSSRSLFQRVCSPYRPPPLYSPPSSSAKERRTVVGAEIQKKSMVL